MSLGVIVFDLTAGLPDPCHRLVVRLASGEANRGHEHLFATGVETACHEHVVGASHGDTGAVSESLLQDDDRRHAARVEMGGANAGAVAVVSACFQGVSPVGFLRHHKHRHGIMPVKGRSESFFKVEIHTYIYCKSCANLDVLPIYFVSSMISASCDRLATSGMGSNGPKVRKLLHTMTILGNVLRTLSPRHHSVSQGCVL